MVISAAPKHREFIHSNAPVFTKFAEFCAKMGRHVAESETDGGAWELEYETRSRCYRVLEMTDRPGMFRYPFGPERRCSMVMLRTLEFAIDALVKISQDRESGIQIRTERA